jgi:hypothetical protein
MKTTTTILTILGMASLGAQAAVLKLDLITRDVARYRTYFPTVRLITPEVKAEAWSVPIWAPRPLLQASVNRVCEGWGG